MNRLESWLLHVSTILLSVTGLVYAWMHYLLKSVDPFSVVNHPLEPYLFSGHVIIAPFLVFGFGMILHGHILLKVGTGARIARRSGLFLIPTFAVMAFSGYLLQIITSDLRKMLVWIHLISGSIWALMYLGHQVASYRMRSKANGRGNRVPVQIVLLPVILIFSATFGIAEPFVREVYSMGTTLRIVSLEPDEEMAVQQTELLIRTIEQTESQLSTWKADSELSRLNQEEVGSPFHATPQLIQLLQKLQKWTRQTGGAFDPGIGRLLDCWGVHASIRIPGAAEIQSALSQSGILFVALNEQENTATKAKDIRIDPGSFGKGEALQRAILTANGRKLAPFLLDFGGQIAVYGNSLDGKGWKANIADPVTRAKVLSQEIFLKSGSLSTSGFSERSGKANGRIINHILNPRTGQPADPFGSVTVWHSDAFVADVLSTALYVMGPYPGMEWASRHHVAAAFSTPTGTRSTAEFDAQLKR